MLSLTLPGAGEQWHGEGLCATCRGWGTLTKEQGTAPPKLAVGVRLGLNVGIVGLCLSLVGEDQG